MKIALIDSFFSGSHQKWGKDLKKFSKHQIQIFSMVGIHWKWRMHGGAITLSKELNNSKFLPDLILITDMVDVAVFKSLLSPKLINTPILIYFHENQIMYPKSRLDTDIIEKRDNHYGFIKEQYDTMIQDLLPGKYTILLKAKKHGLSKLIQNDSELIGIRIPDHDFTIQLVKQLSEPIITTSVNIHGEKPLINLDDIEKVYPEIKIFYDKEILDSKGSTILDLSRDSIHIVRKGDGEII